MSDQADIRSNIWTTVAEIEHVLDSSGALDDSWSTKLQLADYLEDQSFATITAQMPDVDVEKKGPARFVLSDPSMEESVAVNLSAAALYLAVAINRNRAPTYRRDQYFHCRAQLNWVRDASDKVTEIVITLTDYFARHFGYTPDDQVAISGWPKFVLKPTTVTVAEAVRATLARLGGAASIKKVSVDLSALSGFMYDVESSSVMGTPNVLLGLLPAFKDLYTTAIQSYANVRGNYELRCEFPNVYPGLVLSYDVVREYEDKRAEDPRLRFAKQRQMLAEYIVSLAQVYQPYQFVGHVLDEYVLVPQQIMEKFARLYTVFQMTDPETTSYEACQSNVAKLLAVALEVEAANKVLEAKGISKLNSEYNIVPYASLVAFQDAVRVVSEAVKPLERMPLYRSFPRTACTPMLKQIAEAMAKLSEEFAVAKTFREQTKHVIAEVDERGTDEAAAAKVPISTAFYRDLSEARELAKTLKEQLQSAETSNAAAKRDLDAAISDVQLLKKQTLDKGSAYTQATMEVGKARSQALATQAAMSRLEVELTDARKQLAAASTQLSKLATKSEADTGCKVKLAKVKEDLRKLTETVKRQEVEKMKINAVQIALADEQARYESKLQTVTVSNQQKDTMFKAKLGEAKRREANLQNANAALEERVRQLEKSLGKGSTFRTYLNRFLKTAQDIRAKLATKHIFDYSRRLDNFRDVEDMLRAALAELDERTGTTKSRSQRAEFERMAEAIKELEKQMDDTIKTYNTWKVETKAEQMRTKRYVARDPDIALKQAEDEFREDFKYERGQPLTEDDKKVIEILVKLEPTNVEAVNCSAELEKIRTLENKLDVLEKQLTRPSLGIKEAAAEAAEEEGVPVEIPKLSYAMTRAEFVQFLRAQPQTDKTGGISSPSKFNMLLKDVEGGAALLVSIHKAAKEIMILDLCPRLKTRKDLHDGLTLNEALCLIMKLGNKNRQVQKFIDAQLSADNDLRDVEALVPRFNESIINTAKNLFKIGEFQRELAAFGKVGKIALMTIWTQDKMIDFFYDIDEVEKDYFASKEAAVRIGELTKSIFHLTRYYELEMTYDDYKAAVDRIKSEYDNGLIALNETFNAQVKESKAKQKPTKMDRWYVEAKNQLDEKKKEQTNELNGSPGKYTATGPQIFCSANPGKYSYCRDETLSGAPVRTTSKSLYAYSQRALKKEEADTGEEEEAKDPVPFEDFNTLIKKKARAKHLGKDFTLAKSFEEQLVRAQQYLNGVQETYAEFSKSNGVLPVPFPYQAYALLNFPTLLQNADVVKKPDILISKFLEEIVLEISKMRKSFIIVKPHEYADPSIKALLMNNLDDVFQSNGVLLEEALLKLRRSFVSKLKTDIDNFRAIVSPLKAEQVELKDRAVKELPYLPRYALLAKNVLDQLADVKKESDIEDTEDIKKIISKNSKLFFSINSLRSLCVPELLKAINVVRNSRSLKPLPTSKISSLIVNYAPLQSILFSEEGAERAIDNAGEEYKLLAEEAVPAVAKAPIAPAGGAGATADQGRPPMPMLPFKKPDDDGAVAARPRMPAPGELAGFQFKRPPAEGGRRKRSRRSVSRNKRLASTYRSRSPRSKVSRRRSHKRSKVSRRQSRSSNPKSGRTTERSRGTPRRSHKRVSTRRSRTSRRRSHRRVSTKRSKVSRRRSHKSNSKSRKPSSKTTRRR